MDELFQAYKHGQWRVSSFKPATLAIALALAFAGVSVQAQTIPSGGVAVHGQASISTPASNQLKVVTQNGAGTNHSAINWQSFSIAPGAGTTFVQPGPASVSINRVVTNTPSSIFGTLSSNGHLVLVNPSGIAVGAGAVIDTAGFTASALRMGDADALAGRLRFGAADAAARAVGGLSVGGRITARNGDVVLVAPDIDIGASALLQAPNGSTILAAGQQVEITGRGLEGVTMLVQAPVDQVRNLGRLEGNAAAIFAGTLRHSGEIQATTASLDGGTVVLKASGDAYVEGSGKLLATGSTGGRVDVLGNRVAVADQALIDVSGSGGGGTIRIGGDYQGKNTEVRNAQRTYLGPGATLRADAVQQGDGGRVIVWADELTKAYGSISARGGAQGGDGGFVEVSGKHGLVFQAGVDLRAPFGAVGSLLLDPDFIEILATGTDFVSDGDQFSDGPGGTGTARISPFTLNAVGGNVILQSNGDITFVSPVNLLTPGASLTALAGNLIQVDGSITTNGGNITLYSAAPGASGSGTNDSDAVRVNAAITSSGGTITLRGDSCDLFCTSVDISGPVNAGAGSIVLMGAGEVRQSGAGVLTASSLDVTADSTIDLNLAGNNISSNVDLFTNTGTGASSLVQFSNSASSFNLSRAVAKGDVIFTIDGNMTTSGPVQSTTGFVDIVSNGAGSSLSFGHDVAAGATGVFLQTNNGPIIQTGGSVTTSGPSIFAAGTGAISFPNLTNDINDIQLIGGDIHVVVTNFLSVNSLTRTVPNANLHLQSRFGSLTFSGVGAIDTGTGTLTLDSGGTLTTPGDLSGASMYLRGAFGMTLAHNITTPGTLQLTADNFISQSGGVITVGGATFGGGLPGSTNIA
ncbi:MAG: filamentous hemagglutinin N-terminal domain-containing protein, partial [Rhodoferax sp.]|nr:filamentous hemagglutinin N-terminal domain-containing protein [Rhodoferax sp.]